MIKKISIYLMTILLIVVFTISSIYFFIQRKEDKKQEEIFEELENIVEDIQMIDNLEQIYEQKQEVKVNQEVNKEEKQRVYKSQKIDLQELYSINNDFLGWLKIKDSKISYPVVQTEIERKDYYLRKNFYKDYSYYGTPYIAIDLHIKKTNKNQIKISSKIKHLRNKREYRKSWFFVN